MHTLTPLETSQLSIVLARFAASSEPSNIKPNPPFITSPLCNKVFIKSMSYNNASHRFLDDEPGLPANATTVVQGYPRGSPECITNKVLDRHVCKEETLWAVILCFLKLFLQCYLFVWMNKRREKLSKETEQPAQLPLLYVRGKRCCDHRSQCLHFHCHSVIVHTTKHETENT